MPLRFTVASDRVEDYYRILSRPDPDDETIGDLLPRTNGVAKFELSEYFRNKRQSAWSDLLVSLHADACKTSLVKFLEYYGNPPAALNEISWSGAILGGIIPRWMEHEFFKTYASFNAYLVAKKPMLTWYPSQIEKPVLPNQPERLYFLNNIAGTITLSIVVGLYFDDGSFALMNPVTSIEADQHQVVSFASGYKQLEIEAYVNLNHPEKEVTHYYVTITHNDVGISEAFLYKLDRNPYRNIKYLVFRNSLSGFDVLACTGEADQISEVERLTAERSPDVNDSTRLNKIEYSNYLTQFVKQNTGWLSAGEKKWLNDLFISEEIYELNASDAGVPDGNMIRILMRSKQLDYSEKGFAPGDVELEYERLFLAR
jgi:hypothetical protein